MCSNSTFSWWGSRLGKPKQEIIVPDRWMLDNDCSGIYRLYMIKYSIKMKALAVCATYGRLPYLNRMLSSFLEQTYDNKHLVLVNGDIETKLICHSPNVTVINLDKWVPVGEARNIGIECVDADIIFPWDDDDIYYPARMKNHIHQYTKQDISAYRNIPSYTICGNVFDLCWGSFSSLSFTKDAWIEAGKYDRDLIRGEDEKLHKSLKQLFLDNDHTKIDFCYNYGGLNYHTTFTEIDVIHHIAKDQRDKLTTNGEFLITPDFEEYNKFLILKYLFESNGRKPLEITHVNDAKIDIAHLL